jgi:hypothetical protein
MDISYTQSQRCSLRTSHGPLLIYTSTRCIGFALFRQGYEHIHYLIMFSFWYKPERCQQKAPAAVQFSKSNIQMIMIKPANRIDPQPTLRQPRSNRRQKPYRVEAAVNTQCDFPARKDRFQPQRVCTRLLCDERPALALAEQHLERMRLQQPALEGCVGEWDCGENKVPWLE